MGLAIIQLSDIHIKDENDKIIKKTKQLKVACSSRIRLSDDVILIISGDIAFSGKKEQYEVAKSLIMEVSSYLKQQKKCKIHYAFVPGNHDCDFGLSNSVRENLLQSINNDSDNNIYNTVKCVQNNYFEFVKDFDIDSNEIISKKEIIVDDNKIMLLLVNSSWMSVIKERPGKIVIPQYAYNKINNEQYKIIITIQHHPCNWLNPDYSKNHTDFIRYTTDLFFVGHEHLKDSFKSYTNKWAYSEFHAEELQDSNSDSSEFTVIEFDGNFQNYKMYHYKWLSDKNVYDIVDEDECAYHKNPSTKNDVYYPNKQTLIEFNDPGISISHFSKENVTLQDIFVWPDVNKSNIKNESSHDVVIRKGLYEELNKNKISIISGSYNYGKTSLAKMLFLSKAEKENCCLFINGKEFSSADIKKLEKTIEEHYKKQYSEDNFEMFLQLPREERTIIIDCFEEIKPLGEKRNIILDFIFNYFGQVYIFVSSGMEIPQLLSTNCLQDLKDIPYYEIRPLGNTKRKELITKWYYLNGILSSKEVDEKIENVSLQINKLLGNGNSFMPAVPIFMITFLQNIDSINPTTFQGSKYSSLYESLIKRSLSNITSEYITSGLYSIDVTMLSTLAYKMLKDKSLTFSYSDLTETVAFVNEKQKLNIRHEDLIKRMISAKILYQEIEGSDIYRFRYPYMYYYFAGYYLSANASKPDVSDQIEYMSTKLYNEDYGNIIIFVCHFSNNSDIISTILINAYSILDNYDPFKFEDANPIFDDMQLAIEAVIPKNIGDNEDVQKNKEEKLANLDKAGINDGTLSEDHDTIDDAINEKEKDLASLSAAFKTLDVLGQILQNYPGNVAGDLKIEMIDEIHSLGMRAVQSVISAMGLMEEELISVIQDEVKDKKRKSRDQIIREIKNFITMLLSSMIRAMVKKIAFSLNSEYLLPATTETFEKTNLISTKLILQELKMNCLNSFSLSELKALDADLSKKNEFARFILKSIVANYLKFNVCDYKMREKLCDEFELDKKNTFIASSKEKALD